MLLRRQLPALLRRACAPLSSSSATTVLWHNPDCEDSCAVLALLEERGQPFAIREYLTEPPTWTELTNLRKELGPPIEWCRTMEETWLEHFDHATIYDE